MLSYTWYLVPGNLEQRQQYIAAASLITAAVVVPGTVNYSLGKYIRSALYHAEEK